MQTGKFNWRINQQIRATEVRVIGADGKQLGVLKLNEALTEAQKNGLDLVEIAPNAKPPVAKIVELGKFRYEQEKKLQKQKKAAKSGEVKEVRLSPFIAEHDYNVRLTKIREFLDDSNKVRVVVVFTGRQMDSKPFGYELLKKVVANLEGRIAIDMEPKFLGRHLAMVISPVKKGKIQDTNILMGTNDTNNANGLGKSH
ncbi:translation initiation factor IF-3 [Candidatus Woesebacteria bacterium RIFCSPHIGHO2_01_FULL_38_9]|uniref:Translation initiation factor IF-3 n=1 Tax=Candidatus Woesebacteria bacterium RIFCSPHIGHO2_01_FULL_38_9 TaxID=1802492 RepID=A0A1F7Y2C5_9BACT|nr:MAG: translation initiation factor IF-3 [Candidatus Woesebacteria bacterium RIFCSPHIGHO2_01_FULL_38_9]